jgi:hypothetical protein
MAMSFPVPQKAEYVLTSSTNNNFKLKKNYNSYSQRTTIYTGHKFYTTVFHT